MLIGILTQALHGNYGGILQNYALQQVLINLGHTPCTIDRHFYRPDSNLKNVAKWFTRLIKPQYKSGLLSSKQRGKLVEEQMRFISTNINRIGPIYSQADFSKEVTSAKYDAFIVGSDQCWRPRYSTNILNYFLDFCADRPVRKIAYAASFGTDKWEYSSELTQSAANLAQKFNDISVREKSALDLCSTKFHIKASWVLDPTMLLGIAGFQKFINRTDSTGVTTYLLEDSIELKKLIKQVKNLTGESLVTNNLASPIFHRFESLKRHINISVEDWLSNIANAKFVITDSFHGAVFSILFNVPFIVVLNGIRGNTRLESLLSDFELDECLCKDTNVFRIPKIDWNKVNDHLVIRRRESLDFLTKALQ